MRLATGLRPISTLRGLWSLGLGRGNARRRRAPGRLRGLLLAGVHAHARLLALRRPGYAGALDTLARSAVAALGLPGLRALLAASGHIRSRLRL
ncbi:hypothetical protein EBL84_04740 [Marichromatium sp. AB31]|nr:hypothetical protein EBL84_04740 [Marichromatium sp. AB31]